MMPVQNRIRHHVIDYLGCVVSDLTEFHCLEAPNGDPDWDRQFAVRVCIPTCLLPIDLIIYVKNSTYQFEAEEVEFTTWPPTINGEPLG